MKIFFILALLLFPSVSSAMPEDQALNNLGHEYAICAAFYTSLAAHMIAQNERHSFGYPENAISNVVTSAQAAFVASMTISGKEVTEARFSMASNAIEKKWAAHPSGGTSIILNEYGDSCKELMENPDKKFNAFLAQ